jgi:hypothetical protein
MEKPRHTLARGLISHSPSTPNVYRDCPSDEIVPRTRKRLKVRDVGLKFFSREIEGPIRNRFCELIKRYERPLYDHLSKEGATLGTISIKLKILGRSEETAKPGIVILCDKEVSGRVKKFFNQPTVKREYQPPDSVPNLPNFKLLVRDRPPRPNLTITPVDIYGRSWGNKDTLCGELIGVNENDQLRKATIGGIIGLKTSPEGLVIYGMTAGHIVARELPKEEGLSLEESDKESEKGEGEECEDEQYILDDEELYDAALGDQLTRGKDQEPTNFSAPWPKIGHIFVPSFDTDKPMSNLDWALVELDKPSDYRPNLLAPTSSTDTLCVPAHQEPASVREGLGTRRDVVVLTGTEGPKLGILSMFPSFLMLAPGRKFAETYNLALEDGRGKAQS